MAQKGGAYLKGEGEHIRENTVYIYFLEKKDIKNCQLVGRG